MKVPYAVLRIFFLAAAMAFFVECEENASTDKMASVVVVHWPEEGHVFRSGSRIICAYTTRGFDPPREGHVQLLMNGVSVANYTPPSQDFQV